jgi:hypothetical protein
MARLGAPVESCWRFRGGNQALGKCHQTDMGKRLDVFFFDFKLPEIGL